MDETSTRGREALELIAKGHNNAAIAGASSPGREGWQIGMAYPWDGYTAPQTAFFVERWEDFMRKLLPSSGRPWRALLTALAVGGLLAAPTAVLASHRFTDVPSDFFAHDEINALAEAGVTQGCRDGNAYCPSEAVTRAQMAVFLDRLGALSDDEEPVVNADLLDGRDARDMAWTEGVPIQVMHRVETFTIDNPENNEEECASTTSDFELGADTPEGAYTVTYQLTDVPEAGDFGPWDVNVQIAFVDGGQYDVCFATIDGRDLPDGTYTTFRQEMVTIGVS